MGFLERINNGKLLIAAGEGKLEEVKELIEKGADVNFSDAEGNTVLHYAVQSSNLQVVQQLIHKAEMKDVIIENNENKTPLNIARENEKQNIIEAIEEKILDNSFDILKEITFSDTVNESNLQVEKDIKEKIKKKIEVSLQALEELTKNEENIKKLTYKNANVLLVFLEAFALQDVEINKKIEKEQKNKLVECFGENNHKYIGALRSYLVHREDTNMKIELRDLQKLIIKEKSSVAVKNVFTNLKNYAEEVFKKLSENQTTSDIKDLTEILDLNIPRPERKATMNTIIFDLFKNIVETAYSIDVEQEVQEEQDNLEKVMFNLIVNIIPFLSQEGIPENLQKLKHLRNELLHNFHKYENLRERMLELKKSISNLRSDLFKYYYSQKVHDLLQGLPCHQDSQTIKNDLDEKSRDLDNEFHTKLSHVVPPEEGQSFEYIFEKSLLPKKDEDIQVLVEQYLKFMIIIDSKKEEEADQFLAERIKTSAQYRELSDLQKREIFEDFVQLQQILQNFNKDYRKAKQKELKKKLGDYGITENYFDEVIEFYLEGNNSFHEETQYQAEKIKHIITLLCNILEGTKQLSIVDVINLYKASPSHNYEDIFERADLVEDQIQNIKHKLNCLPTYNEIVDISIADKNIQINISETVINILKMFYNSYNKYQIKFNNMKEAFNDKTFLNYLVIRDTKVVSSRGSQQKKFEFKDKNYVFKIIKKLMPIEYTAPYIANLIIKVQSDEVIERDDLRKLIEILLEKDSYIICLTELLSTVNTVHKLYEEVCNKMLEKKDINIKSMDIICKESKPVKGILAALKERINSNNRPSDDVVKLTKMVLGSVNNTILYWSYQHKYEKAKEIANLVKPTYEALKDKELVKDDDPIVVDHKLNLAKVINFLGSEAKRQNKDIEVTEYYNEALKLLEEVHSCTDPKQFLLVLSRKAYTNSLLGKHEESYKIYEELWKEIVKSALYLTKDIPRYDKKITTYARKSQWYVDLLALSSEHKKYLDLLQIRLSMGYEKGFTNCEVAYEIYKEVYDTQKFEFGMDDISTLRTIARIAKTNCQIAKKNQMDRKYKVALQYYYDSLVEEIRTLKIKRNIYGNFHPIIRKQSLQQIINILHYIVKINSILSKLEQLNNRKYYNTIRKIRDKLNKIQ